MRPVLIALLGSGLSWLAAEAPAQDIEVDENSLFADTSSITDSAKVVRSAEAEAERAEGKTVGFSGNILNVAQTGLTRAWFDRPDADQSNLETAVLGNLALDIRMQRSFKAFAELEWSYRPPAAGSATSDSGAAWRLPEMFLDANIRHRAYFRAGKQVLQWGRCYFFNPTDLINVERKTFFRRIGSREGVYGAKVHVPFGTAWNLYGFLDAHGVSRPDSLAGALRAERLLGRTEMSVMIWDRGGREPVYGADASTRILGLDVNAELALHQEFRKRTFSFSGGAPVFGERRDDWAPRASLGLGRSFRVSGIKDRLTTVAEYYYNGPGNTDRRLGLAPLLTAAPATEIGLPGSGLAGAEGISILAASGFYEPNSYSRHYAAVFATFNRFLRRDLTLNFNAIGNLNQRCALISSGIAYRDLNDFGLGLWVNGFAGPEDTEYTLAGQAVQVQLIAEAAF
jgi:hypothetical protein